MSEVRPVIAKGQPPSEISDDEIARWRAEEDERRRLAQFEGWERPAEFTALDLPPFPLDALPPVLADFVRAESEFSQTPPDMAAMLCLAACGAAIGKHAVVEVKPGYREPMNLFVAVVLPPGERKSAVLNAVTAPLEEWERSENERLKPQIAYSVMKAKTIEKQIENQMRIAAKAKSQHQAETAEAEIQQLTDKLAAHKLLVPPRILCDDATPEALVSLMAQTGGRAAQFSAEGGVFSMLGGRYSDKVSLDAYLKGHAGENIRVDRKGRAAEFVENPALTVGLAVQPAILESFSDNPQFRGVGLLARFLYSLPTSKLGSRRVDTPSVPDNVMKAYALVIERMLTIPRTFGDKQLVMKMSSDARRRQFDFAEWIEPQLSEFGELDSIRDWAAKIVGAVARIAGILSILRILAIDSHFDFSSIYIGIDPESMGHAIAIGRYLVQHALAAFSVMGLDEKSGDARALLRVIEKHTWQTFSHREIQQSVRNSSRFGEVEKLDATLGVLAERGFVRKIDTERRQGPGRPSGPSFEVNPYFILRSKNTHNPQNGHSCSGESRNG